MGLAFLATVLPLLPMDARLPVRLERIDSLVYNQISRLGVPWSGRADVYYIRRDANSGDPSGIYNGPARGFVLVGDTVDGNNVSSIGIECVAGSNVLFSATKFIANKGQSSLYLNQSEIISRDSPLPGFPSPHPAPGGPFGRASVDEFGQVAFHVNEYRIRDEDQPSAIILWDGSTFTTIATEEDVSGTINLGTRPVVDEDTVTFIYGETAWGSVNSSAQGIYQWTGDNGQGGLERIIDYTSPVVGGGNVGSPFLAEMLDVDGRDMAWVSGRKLFKRTGGSNLLVGYSGMPFEGSAANVNSFAFPSLRNGAVVFAAGRGSTSTGIYTDQFGPVHTIVDTKTNLDGKTGRRFFLATGGAWASDNSIHFNVEFSDFSWGVFKATWARPLHGTTQLTAAGSVRISFDTTVGFTYHLRSTPDLVTSLPVESVAGNGERLQFEVSVSDSSGSVADFFWIEVE